MRMVRPPGRRPWGGRRTLPEPWRAPHWRSIDAGAASVCTPSPSMNVRNQSSRLSSIHSRSHPSVLPGRVVAEQSRGRIGIDDAAFARAPIEQDLADRSVPLLARPSSKRHREIPSSAARGSTAGRTPFIASRNTRLVVQPGELPLVRHRRGELDELVIEERDAALDRRGHAHLVLLHEQFDQIRLHVRVEQARQQAGAGWRPVEPRLRRAVGAHVHRVRPALARQANRADPQAGWRRSCRGTSPPECVPSPGTTCGPCGPTRPGSDGTRLCDTRDRRLRGTIRS